MPKRGRQQSVSFKAGRRTGEQEGGSILPAQELRCGTLSCGAVVTGSKAQVGDGHSQHRKRWFVLGNECMEYYRDEESRPSTKPLGVIDFGEVLRVIPVAGRRGREPDTFAVHAQYRTWYLHAESAAEREEWEAAVEKAVEEYQDFKEVADAPDEDANELIEKLAATLALGGASAEQTALLAKLRKQVGAMYEGLAASQQRAAVRAEEVELARDSADDALLTLGTLPADNALLTQKVSKLEANNSSMVMVLESADEHVRDAQMLLQMPAFDQRALDAKEKELGELVSQISGIMAATEKLAKRTFSAEELQAASPRSNPELRDEIVRRSASSLHSRQCSH